MKMEDNTQPQLNFKITLLGESNVGKTNIIASYLNDKSIQIKPTMGMQMFKKDVIKEENKIFLKLFDAPGAERHRENAKIYSVNSNGGFIVYDITKKESFKKIDEWVKLFRERSSPKSPIILIGNKSDLNDQREISEEEGRNKAEELNFSFYETSAIEKKNIDEAFDEMIKQILKREEELKIEKENQPQKKGGCCDCF